MKTPFDKIKRQNKNLYNPSSAFYQRLLIDINRHLKITRFKWLNNTINNRFILIVACVTFFISAIILGISIFLSVEEIDRLEIYVIIILNVLALFFVISSGLIIFLNIIKSKKLQKLFWDDKIVNYYYQYIFYSQNDKFRNLEIKPKWKLKLDEDMTKTNKYDLALSGYVNDTFFLFGTQTIVGNFILKWNLTNIFTTFGFLLGKTNLKSRLLLEPFDIDWSSSTEDYKLVDFYKINLNDKTLPEVNRVKLNNFVIQNNENPRIIINNQCVQVALFQKNKLFSKNKYQIANFQGLRTFEIIRPEMIIDKILQDYLLIRRYIQLLRCFL